MADARVRDLERAAGAGDVDAQARLLVERVRAGRLTQERLELAAYAGDAAALTALGNGIFDGKGIFWSYGGVGAVEWPKLGLTASPADFHGFMDGLLCRWASPPYLAPVRAALAAARLDFEERPPSGPLGSLEALWRPSALAQAERWLLAVERWLDCPCKGHEPSWLDSDDGDEIRWSVVDQWSTWAVTRAVLSVHEERGRLCAQAVYNAVREPRRTNEQVRYVVSAALIAWALA